MSVKTLLFEVSPRLLRSMSLTEHDRTTDLNRKSSGAPYTCLVFPVFLSRGFFWFYMDALDQLCNIYQNGRPLEEYIRKFLPCSRQVSLDRWTLVDYFRSGLDEEIAQRMPLAGSSWTLPNYINLARPLSGACLLATNPEFSLIKSIQHKSSPLSVLSPCLPVVRHLSLLLFAANASQFLGQARQPPLPQAQSPLQSPLRSRSSQSPLQSPLRSRSSQSPLQSPLRSRSSQSPLQSPLRSRSSQNPLQSPLRSKSSQSPLQSPLRSKSSQSPLQSPFRSRSSQSPLQSTPKYLRFQNTP